jgi:putative ABC transport system permease protein
MRTLARFLARLRNFAVNRRNDKRLQEEIQQHITLQTEDNIRAGMPPNEARRRARLEFGALEPVREDYRAEEGLPILERLIQDARFAVRTMRKSRSFSFVAVLTLALGIGATAAMFSVTEAVVLRPLPYADANRIVDIQTFSPSGYWQMSSWPGYLELRRLASCFEALAGYEDFWGMTMKAGDRSRYLNVVQGSDNFFDVLGAGPLLGRTFAAGEDQPGKNNVVVLSYEVWRQSFNGDAGVVGRTINLDGDPYVVIGVMPAGFRFPLTKPDLLYIPVHVRSSFVGQWRVHWLMTVGRLKPGVSIQQGQADLSHVLTEIGREKPDSDKGRTVTVAPISTAVHGKSELPEIAVMLGAVFTLLLIACANVTGLLLARGVTRGREMALRVAIGSSPGRLLRQLIVENSVLGMIGAGAGLLFALGLLTAMRAFLIRAFMRGGEIHLNVEVVIITLVTGVLSSVGAGMIPAVRAARSNPNESLKSGVSTGTSHHQRRLRTGFVVAQVSLSVLLLIFSGVLLLTLRRMLQTNIGFNPSHVLQQEVNFPSGDFKDRDYVQGVMMPLAARVRTIPGVTAASWKDQGPLLGYGAGTVLPLVGQPPDLPNHERAAESRSVASGFFRALRIPILRGRDFDSRDTATSQPVAIVNEAWVKEFLRGNQDPLTQAFQQKEGNNIAIVGVVGDARQDALEPARPEIDFPLSRFTLKNQQDAGSLSFFLYVRTAGPPLSVVPQLHAALHEIAPTIAFQTPITMDDLLSEDLVNDRMESWVFGVFAGIAAFLVATGIYGLLMQEVACGTRDIGVRMALGASRGVIARLMFRRISILLVVGLGIGLCLVIALRRLVAGVVAIQLARDGGVIAAVVTLLGLIGFIAAVGPVWRATSVDPTQALRSE